MKVGWKKAVLRKFGKVIVQWEGRSQSRPSEEFPSSQECPPLLVPVLAGKSSWEGQHWCHSGNGFLNATAGAIAQLWSSQLEL